MDYSSQRIKVLRILTRLNIGGPSIHAVLLTASLDEQRFESVLLCGSVAKGEGDMSYYAREKGVRVQYLPRLGRELHFFSDLWCVLKVFSIILRYKPDIVHTHTAKAGTVGRIAAILARCVSWGHRIRLVHTFHGHVFHGYFGKVKSSVFVLIERFLALFTDTIVTISQALRQELIHLSIAPGHKVLVIPLGFELAPFLVLHPPEQSNSSVGIVGRLVPIKNHRVFLEGVSLCVKEISPAAQFYVVGDGPLRVNLEKYAVELGVQSRVHFQGWKNTVSSVYEALSIVVLTSDNEGTPVSIIEAMASARSVVATNVGGVKDLLGDELFVDQGDAMVRVCERGILVPPRNPRALVKAIALLLGDSALRARLGANGREYARSTFTKERLVGDIERLYKELVRVPS